MCALAESNSKGCLLIFKNADGRIGPVADNEDVEELFSQCDPDFRVRKFYEC